MGNAYVRGGATGQLLFALPQPVRKHFSTCVPLVVLLAIGCIRDTPHSVQQRYARSMTPGQARTAPTRRPIREMTLRVYADQSFRAGRSRWRQKFNARLTRVNAILGTAFGVRLVVVGMVNWQRPGSDTGLSAVLNALEREDPAESVDWVIGLTTSTPMVSSSLHELGMAYPMSKHFVMRGMDNVGEVKRIDTVFSALSSKERRSLYFRRRQHKELIVFLHEWAHTLGAIHSGQRTHVLNPSYDNQQDEFCGPNAHIIRLGLRHRQQRGDTRLYTSKLVTYVGNVQWDYWDSRDRAQLLAYLKQWEKTAGTRSARAATPDLSAGPAERLIHEDAAAYLRDGDINTAWSTLRPGLEQFPDSASLHLLACSVGEQAGAPSPRVVAACSRAATLDAQNVEVAVRVGRMLGKAGDLRGAARSLALAGKLLGTTAADDTWRAIAEAYQDLSFVTYAEQAATHVTGARDITEWATSTRRRLGMPRASRRFVLKHADEAEYARGFWLINEEMRQGNLKHAKKLVAKKLRRFANAPGYLAQRCEIHLRSGRVKPARASCERAIAIDNECAWAHFLLGTIFDRLLQRDKAAVHFRRVIALDAALESAWKSLAKVYRAGSKKDELVKLRARYKNQFGREL